MAGSYELSRPVSVGEEKINDADTSATSLTASSTGEGEGNSSNNNSIPEDSGTGSESSSRSSKSSTSSLRGPHGKSGNEHVVVRRRTNWTQHRQPLQQQDSKMSALSGNSESQGKMENPGETKGNGNTKTSVDGAGSRNSTSGRIPSGSLPSLYMVTRSSRPQVDENEIISATAVGATASQPLAGSGSDTVGSDVPVDGELPETSTSDKTAGRKGKGAGELQNKASPSTTAAQGSKMGGSGHSRLSRLNVGASRAASQASQGVSLSNKAAANVQCVTSVSCPQMAQHGEDSYQMTGGEKDLREKRNITRERSVYLNVSLNSLAEELTIISYNIQMLVDCCSLSVNWSSREPLLVQYVRKIAKERSADVIVFQECWSGTSQQLVRSLAKNVDGVAFPYQTRVLGLETNSRCCSYEVGDCYCTMGECFRDCCCRYKRNDRILPTCCCCCFAPLFRRSRFGRRKHKHKNEPCPEADNEWTTVSGAFSRARRNGGVMIVSKWPLLERHAYIFKHSTPPDALENKGAVYVRVQKFGKIYNIVGTHMQSGERNNNVRLAQFREMAAWLRSGMEACEQEFFSAEAEQAIAEEASSAPSKGRTTAGWPAGAAPAQAQGGAKGAKAPRGKKAKEKRGGLPRDLIKASEPLIICGDFNTRLTQDRETLTAALSPDCLNCRLCFLDPEHATPTYDTVADDTCAARKCHVSDRRQNGSSEDEFHTTQKTGMCNMTKPHE